MSSVASEIRIDILANSARFTAGMREAGQGLGSFNDEFNRTVKGFDTLKARMDRSAGEAKAWKSSMSQIMGADSRGIMGGQDLMLGGAAGGDVALANQTRWKSMLPWGNSMRVELTREAAETAAAIGAGSRRIGSSLVAAEREMGSLSFSRSLRAAGTAALGRGPLRPFAAMGMAVEDFSPVTKALGIFAAGLLVAHTTAASLGNEIKQTREEAVSLGMTYDRFVTMKGLPTHSAFTEGAALAATEGWTGLKGAGAQVFGGVVALLGAGYGGVRSIAAGAREDDKQAVWVRSVQERSNQITSAKDKLHEMAGELASIRGQSEQFARQDFIDKFTPTPQMLRGWDELIDKIHQARELTKLSSQADAIHDQIQTPADRLEARLDTIRRVGDRLNDDEKLTAAAKATRDYFREDMGMDFESMVKASQDPLKRYRTELEGLGNYQKAMGLLEKPLSHDELVDVQTRMRRQTTAEISALEHPVKIQPVAAMEAGSAQAHAAIVRSMIADPKTQLAQDTNKKLDQVERELLKHSDILRGILKAVRE
jgi:hypothetical protein